MTTFMSTPYPEVCDLLSEFGASSLRECMQCGTCSGVCPVSSTGSFNTRQIIRRISLGLEGYEDEMLWKCVSCGMCVAPCPREVDPLGVIQSTRAMLLENGTVPRFLRSPLGSLGSEGNPWQATREERIDHCNKLQLPALVEKSENLLLLFPCCTHTEDPRNAASLDKLIGLLNRAEVPIGIQPDLVCCGELARSCGAIETANNLLEKRSRFLGNHQVKEMVVTSPHCLQSSNGQKILTTYHYTVLLARLLREQRLIPVKSANAKVVYHDPCYLGRQGGIFKEPREILAAIPGIELLEFNRTGMNSFCCGGGGGGIWRETRLEERLSVRRIREAVSLGAEVIATACPLCTIMLEDAVLALDIKDLKIMELSELLALSF